MIINLIASLAMGKMAKSAKQATCPHNMMVGTGDKHYAWKCADCGYIYGQDDSLYAEYLRTFPYCDDPRR